MSNLSINCNCPNLFIINKDGISSLEPINLTSVEWKNNNLTLKCPNQFGGTYFSGSTNEDITIINGTTYINEVKNNNNNSNKIFSRSFGELNLSNPTLSVLNISGGSKFTVDIPLNNNCDLNVAGNGSIDILNNNSVKSLKAKSLKTSVIGGGRIKGNMKVEHCNVRVTGSGKIKDFTCEKSLSAKIIGSGQIKLTSHSVIDVNKKIIGSGKIKVTIL